MTGMRELATNPSDSQKEQDSAGGSRECIGIEGGGGRRPAGSWADSTTGMVRKIYQVHGRASYTRQLLWWKWLSINMPLNE